MEKFTARQEDILYATVDLIYRHGFHALTVKSIAGQLGMTDAALYKHFAGKHEIMSGVLDLFKKDSDDVLALIGSSGCGPVECIRSFFMDRCRVFQSHPAMTIFMLNDELMSNADFMSRVRSIIKDHKTVITGHIRAAQKTGELADIPPEHVFIIIMGVLRLLVHMWKLSGESFDLYEHGAVLWEDTISVLKRNVL